MPRSNLGKFNLVAGLLATALAFLNVLNAVIRYNELYTDRSFVAVVLNNAGGIALMLVCVVATVHAMKRL